MAYNSLEEKEKGEILAKKTEHILALARDKDFQALLTKSVDDAQLFITELHEKAQYEPLDQTELASLNEMQKKITVLLQFVQDCQLVLGNQLLLAADTQYYHVKDLAAQGDPQAKEAYEKLRPLYRNGLNSTESGLGLN